MKKIIALSLLAIATIATADPERGIKLQPSGSNFIVIHEYGSKKIFSEGSLAMGDSSDTLVGTADLDKPNKDLRSVPLTRNYVGKKEKTTNVKFDEISPSHYSYFVPNSHVSPYMTTSFYFTGEGRLSEGGTNSKVFKNKFNINNLLSYCSLGKKVDCINFLNQFNEDASIYMIVRNGTTNTADKDKRKLDKLEDIVMNGSINEGTRAVAKAKLIALKKYLKLAWSIDPVYYEQYERSQINPYMFMSIMNNTVAGNNITANNNLPYGIRGALPYLHTSTSFYNPKIYIDNDKKYLGFSQIVPAKRSGRRRSRTYSCPEGELINGTQCLIRNASNSLNLSDTEKLLSSYGASSFSALAQTGVSAGMVGYIYVSNDKKIRQQSGSRTNRGTTDFINANYITYAKSSVNSFNANKSFNAYYTDAKRKEIAANLANLRANALRVYEVNYGVTAKPMQTSNGTGITQATTFAKTSDVFQMENFFDANKNDLAFISKMNSYINFNDEAYTPKDTMTGLHDLDEEGFYLAGKGKEQAKATTMPGKYNDEIGDKSYTTSYKLDLFYTPNNMLLGHNTKFGIEESYRMLDETNNRDITPELGVKNINNETLSNTTENDSILLNHYMQEQYASFTSCMLDDACFAYFMATESGTYDEVSKFANGTVFLPETEYPLRLNINRKLQAIYTPDEKGIYQFFGPQMDKPEQYCGAYMDQNNQKQEWCIVAYKPKTTKLEFKERDDVFYRYKQDAADNFFYLLPKSERGGATDTAITLSNNTPKIGRAVKSVEPTTSYKEDYTLYKNNGSNELNSYDYTLTRVDVGLGNKLPDHNSEIAKADSDDLFINKAHRPDWMHMQLNYHSAIEDYVDDFLKNTKFQNMACGLGSSEDEDSGTVTNEDPTKKIGFANCKVLIDSVKNYLMNSFTTEAYLTKYQGNYKLLAAGKVPSPYNKFGMVYNLDNDEAIEQNSNAAAQENKRRDVARSLTEIIMNKYWSKFDTDREPDSEYRQWLIKDTTLAAKKYDYNPNSKLNLCAKASGWGLSEAVTGEKAMPFSECLNDMSDSQWTPTPPPSASSGSSGSPVVLEKEVEGLAYNGDGTTKTETTEQKKRKEEAEKILTQMGVDPKTLKTPGFYKKWVEVEPNRLYMLEYGAIGDNYFTAGTYVLSIDLNRYINDFSKIEDMRVLYKTVDDHNEIKINGRHMHGIPNDVPDIIKCEGGGRYGRIGANNDCNNIIDRLEKGYNNPDKAIDKNFADILDPKSNILVNTLLVGGRGENHIRIYFKYKKPKGINLEGGHWHMYPTNYWSIILNPFGFDFYLKKEGNEDIDISKTVCLIDWDIPWRRSFNTSSPYVGTTGFSIKGDYYFIPLSEASEWGGYPGIRCNFVFKDGTKRQITFDTDDTASAQTSCAYRTGGKDEECLKLKVVKDIPIN